MHTNQHTRMLRSSCRACLIPASYSTYRETAQFNLVRVLQGVRPLCRVLFLGVAWTLGLYAEGLINLCDTTASMRVLNRALTLI
jgi:hypothetical protein